MADVTIAQQIFQDVQQHDISAGAVNHTSAFGTDFRLASILINRVGGGGNDDFVATFNSGTNSANDVVFLSETLSNDEDFHYQPDNDFYFKDGDEITYTFPTVGGASRTLNVTITAVQE